ncbi:hypothetical protein C4J81_00705 [Deltaproteobacteria bacterium Smac51]|nr:hypothetical protein C4J81_00705 [Deltaproteobacteria bacterium Smac51]
MDYAAANALIDRIVINKNDWSHSLDGLVIKRMVLGLAFYFYEDEAPQSRAAIIKIVENYADLAGSRLRWTTNPDTGGWEALKDGYYSSSTLDRWLMKADRDIWQFTYHGGQDHREASNIEIGGMGGGIAHPKKLSFLYCYFPLEGFFEKIWEMRDLAYKWADMLKPFHGYGGLTLADHHDLMTDIQLPSSILDSYYSCVYPGVNINRFNIDAEVLTQEIKSADWLTFLSDHFLEKLGGSDEVETKLSSHSAMLGRPYPGGTMIMAGLGESIEERTGKEPREMIHLRNLARIIEPVRKKDHPGYFTQRDDIILNADCKYLNPVQFRVWLARFSPVYMTIKPVTEVLPGKRPRIKR